MYNKAIIRFGFCDIPNNQGLGFKVLSASTFGRGFNNFGGKRLFEVEQTAVIEKGP